MDDDNYDHGHQEDSACDQVNDYFVDENKKLMTKDLHVMQDYN